MRCVHLFPYLFQTRPSPISVTQSLIESHNESITHWLIDSLTQWLTDSMTQWLNESVNHSTAKSLTARQRKSVIEQDIPSSIRMPRTEKGIYLGPIDVNLFYWGFPTTLLLCPKFKPVGSDIKHSFHLVQFWYHRESLERITKLCCLWASIN